jgi:iron complex outermembrane receptor protein
VKTFPVDSRVGQLLGAQPLKPEKSHNVGLGVALEPVRALSMTVDYYRIRIDDRIVLSGNFTSKAVRDFLAANGASGSGGGRYFTNAINTITNGLDVVASYGMDFGSYGTTRFTAGYNGNRTKIDRVNTNTPAALGNLDAVLYDRIERGRIEHGQPKDTYLFSLNHTVKSFDLNVRVQRFGEVTSFGADTAGAPPFADGTPRFVDQTFAAKHITDASLGYTLRRTTLTIGADNIFDVYPDRNDQNGSVASGFGGNSNFGIFPYNGISPFGFNGRFVYVRASYSL